MAAGSCYVSSVCYQAAPCCSDQGADLGQHVWGLDTRMSDDVGKLSGFFSLTLLQDSFFIFQQARGLSWHTSPCGECAYSHLEATLGDWLPARLVFYFLTLAPRDYVTYCQARGLAVGVCPPGILKTRHGPHHQGWLGPQDKCVHSAARRALQDIV